MSKPLFVLLPLHFGMSEESMYDIACLVVNNLICEITWLGKKLEFQLSLQTSNSSIVLDQGKT